MKSDTGRAQMTPKIAQLSFFLENRVGQLLGIAKQLDMHGVHICGIAIVENADLSLVRMVFDRPAEARTALTARGLQVYEQDLLAVEMPLKDGIDISSILGTMLRAEINISYVYPLIVRSNGQPVLAFHVDSTEEAIAVLRRHGLVVVGQDEIQWEGP